MTGQNVTECIGGAQAITDDQLARPLPHPLRPAPQRQPGAGAGLPAGRGAEGRARQRQRQAAGGVGLGGKPSQRRLSSGPPPGGPLLMGGGEGYAGHRPALTQAAIMHPDLKSFPPGPITTSCAPSRRWRSSATSASPMRCSCAARWCRRRGCASSGCRSIAKARNTELRHRAATIAEGKWVGAGEPILYITGSFVASRRYRDDLPAEAGPGLRRRLQRLHHVRRPAPGRPSSPWMRATAPARRWPSMMAYAASVGSARAKRKVERQGLHRQRHGARRRITSAARTAWAPCRTR